MFGGLVVALAVAVPTQEAVSVREELKPLQFLVGSCWTDTFPGGKATDTHCFESVFQGKFIRDRHIVRGGKGAYEGETLYAWDSRQKQVTYTYWASDGGTSTGTMEAGEGGLVFSEAYTGETGPQKMRNLWRITGSDTYEIVVSQWKDGAWREMWRMAMRRDSR